MKIQKINIPGLTINARVWGEPEGIPVLGMHGWMDNAATFDLLAPLLPWMHLVSVDLPGHGFSDHLPPCSNYLSVERAFQMQQVADQLGWNSFSIMGHSLGGIVGQIMAAIFPNRIEKLVIIDAFGPITKPADTIVEQLRQHHAMCSKLVGHSLYPTLEYAAENRVKSSFTGAISLKAAETLVAGGTEKTARGYAWTFDTRLHTTSPYYLTPEQSQAILNHITTPCLLIEAEKGILDPERKKALNIEQYQNVKIVRLPGGHHLHLDDPAPVAKVITEWFGVKFL